MIPPDQEIYEVERRIAERRHRVEAVARQSGQAALRALTSPWAIGAAAVLGFLAACGILRRHEHRAKLSRDQKKAAKVGGLTSIAMAAASWLIKAQFGSPAALAQFVMSKVKKQPPQPVRASSRGDRAATATRR
ncbi:MAG: hypothetical protein JO292_02940 [Betaproteobacteria bacterium]|nr:hypothetical protein [Betaproteobacteria bacterium]MBV9360325.1 hypothetical protein [Betaproteobacteria bacterium]